MSFPTNLWYSNLAVRETQYSVLRPYVIAHRNTFLSTIRDCFQQIGMRPRGWQFVFPHTPAIMQFTLS